MHASYAELRRRPTGVAERDPREQRAAEPAPPGPALTPQLLRFLQTTAGNQRVVARLQAGGLSDAHVERAVAYVAGRGYTDELIKQIQSAIGAAPDGDFGPISARAAATWQAAHGLGADGRVGPATLAAMGLATGGAPGAAPAAGGGSAAAPAAPETAPAAPAAPETAPAAPETEAPAAPVSGDLLTLMTKPQLSDEEIDMARELIAALPDAGQRADYFVQLQSKVAYHSQRDNQSKSGDKLIGDVMCNLTSLAMCLEYLGVDNPYPEMQYEDALEKIRVEHVGKPRTTSEGWGGVATYMGVQWGFVKGAGAKGKDWYDSNVKPHLAAGEAVMLSIDGHICRLQAVAEDGLVADDPFGHSTLGRGGARGWAGTNVKSSSTSNKGEDITWPWADVERHAMLWIAWFKA
jgi:peptidoglycan hydrolase-like protein with peptidoglycan-binding domain